MILPVSIQMLPLISVCMARTIGMVIFLPVLSGHPVNSRLIKSALALMIAFPVIGHHWGDVSFADVAVFPLILLIAKEMLVGVCIGFSAAIPFWAIEIAGFLIDTIRGATMAELFNVMLKSQTSLFGILFSLALNVLFLSLGGMNVLLHALYRSYVTLPIMPFKLHLSNQLIDFFSMDIHLIFSLALAFSLASSAYHVADRCCAGFD